MLLSSWTLYWSLLFEDYFSWLTFLWITLATIHNRIKAVYLCENAVQIMQIYFQHIFNEKVYVTFSHFILTEHNSMTISQLPIRHRQPTSDGREVNAPCPVRAEEDCGHTWQSTQRSLHEPGWKQPEDEPHQKFLSPAKLKVKLSIKKKKEIYTTMLLFINQEGLNTATHEFTDTLSLSHLLSWNWSCRERQTLNDIHYHVFVTAKFPAWREGTNISNDV